MSQPAYPNPLPTAAVVQRLSVATRHPKHEFWPDDLSVLDPAVFDVRQIHGPRQVTDLYLLALAVRHEGTFATLDDRISIVAVADATPANLSVV
jgi:predicted nucleic acid-binding protein